MDAVSYLDASKGAEVGQFDLELLYQSIQKQTRKSRITLGVMRIAPDI
jgi:hypothetical protein